MDDGSELSASWSDCGDDLNAPMGDERTASAPSPLDLKSTGTHAPLTDLASACLAHMQSGMLFSRFTCLAGHSVVHSLQAKPHALKPTSVAILCATSIDVGRPHSSNQASGSVWVARECVHASADMLHLVLAVKAMRNPAGRHATVSSAADAAWHY